MASQRRWIFKQICKISLVMCFLSVMSADSTAKDLPKPEGKIILTVTGRVENVNQGSNVVFDLPMLESLGVIRFTTMTPWYNEKVTFEGVQMSRLLDYVGAKGSSVTVTALNDYVTEIPVSDFTAHNVILAMKRNGAYMPINDKGPLFIVYNYDSKAELKHQRFYSRSAWQVYKIQVK